MRMLKEFKEFAMKGNVIDMAVGVIIGGAFGKIVGSVIEDLIMPIVGKLIGNVDFSNLYVPLSSNIVPGTPLLEAKKMGPLLAYGNFLTIVINFIILALCVFAVIKIMNGAKKKEALPTIPTTKECTQCFSTVNIKALKCAFCQSSL